MNWSIDLTQIILFALTALGAFVTAHVVPWIKSKTTAQQQEFINLLLETGVKAAEQLYESGEGQLKKQFVINYLEEHHLTVDDTQLEAKVNELFSNVGVK